MTFINIKLTAQEMQNNKNISNAGFNNMGWLRWSLRNSLAQGTETAWLYILGGL